MQLEQIMEYQPQVSQEIQTTYFVVGNLESLSASALYTGDLTIRPLGPNVSLHIHEGAGGTAQLKTKKNEYQGLSSYEAAMLDLQMDIASLPKIYTADKCDRKGRR